MASTYVRCIQGEEKMQITLEYGHEGGTSRAYNLDRKQTEEVGTALNRLKVNLAKNLFKKKKKKKNVVAGLTGGENKEVDAENTLNVVIVNSCGRKVDETIPNQVAWAEGNKLMIGDTHVPIIVNPPTVKLLPLPSSIMAGFPIFPRFELEFADLQQSTFTWQKEDVSPVEEGAGVATEGHPVIKSTHPIYTPDAGDIGCRLKLTCVPGRTGRRGREDCVVSDEVRPGPGPCPFEARQEYTSHRTEDGTFRVVSYNILAETYSDTEYARDVLFSYCPPYALEMDYRRQLLLKEITGYNADVVCLQEVDRKVFENELLPSLDMLGFTGALKIKGQQGNEGVATFIRSDKFRIISQHDVLLTDMLMNSACCSDLREAVEKLPKLKAKIEDRGNVLQAMVLETVQSPQRLLIVANTHFYFHPEAGHLRLLQAATSLRHLQSICELFEQQGREISLVFCGDFNSTPHHGVNALITTGYIPEDYADWNDGGDEERIQGLQLQHRLKLSSACGYVDFTNFTPNFQDMLDYIFIDTKNLSVKNVVPSFTVEELTLHTAIPSVVFPSDHIAQICDLTWSA
ncbi:hypothetical protein C0Q70_02013 [Pomacea canaliculata]|uniref:2',5'-phosphodiesterase 12 n=2 Tax=Pomacea canaliculata TaxID=400727 RepID=A0A2T7Q136_POMCA|nr:hypothetical protein C0Q70_02013 [Pomacea canaliculata]